MTNAVEAELRRLTMTTGYPAVAEQRFEKLADAVQRNLPDAIAAYATTEHKFQLVWCFQGIVDPKVLSVLKDAVRSKDKYLRWAAVEGLKHYKDSDLVPLFTAAAKDRSHLVKDVAVAWLKNNA